VRLLKDSVHCLSSAGQYLYTLTLERLVQLSSAFKMSHVVCSFAMICYELFEGRKPFSEMNATAAARAASLFDRRPPWGKVNRCRDVTTVPPCHVMSSRSNMILQTHLNLQQVLERAMVGSQSM
jgi:hypothetical protein